MTWRGLRIGPARTRGWVREGWLEERTESGRWRWFARRRADPDRCLPPLVVVHGLVVSGSYFEPLLDHLDVPNPIFVPDLPGFGRSESPFLALGIEALADHLAGWMDEHGISDAVMVANSMGCQVVTALAVRRPDLVGRAILIGPTIDPAAPSLMRIALRGARDIPRERQTLWPTWIGDLFRSGLRRALLSLWLAIRDPQPERLPHMTQPALVITGERDPIVSTAWIEQMAGSLPKGKAVIVPGAPHALNFSTPGDLAHLIRTVVAEVSSPASSTG